jgi:hypothetical protein
MNTIQLQLKPFNTHSDFLTQCIRIKQYRQAVNYCAVDIAESLYPLPTENHIRAIEQSLISLLSSKTLNIEMAT